MLCSKYRKIFRCLDFFIKQIFFNRFGVDENSNLNGKKNKIYLKLFVNLSSLER